MLNANVAPLPPWRVIIFFEINSPRPNPVPLLDFDANFSNNLNYILELVSQLMVFTISQSLDMVSPLAEL